MGEDVLQEKGILQNVATIKRFQYCSLCSELEKQTGIAKDQYKLFKGQINVININKEDGIKPEKGEIIDIVNHSYIEINTKI